MTKLRQGFWRWLKKIPKAEKTEEEKRTDHKSERPIPPKSAIISSRKPVKIFLGLDFGTSCTKIVYSQGGRNFSKALTFNHRLEPVYPCFSIPSLADINQKGQLILGIDAAESLINKPLSEGLRLLKVVVAGKHEASFRNATAEEYFFSHVEKCLGSADFVSPELITAIFIAHSIKFSREIIQNKPEYKNHSIDLTINICVPINHIENNKVWTVFKHIFAWAEVIEKKWRNKKDSFDPILFAKKIESEVSYGETEPKSFYRKDPEARVYATPESIANVASYLRSLQRRGGIHALIDIGAGTTDVSIFNLLLPNQLHPELRPLWYSSGNIPKGTNQIEQLISRQELGPNAVPFSLTQLAEVLQRLSLGEIIDSELDGKIRKEILTLWGETLDIWREGYRKLRDQTYWNNIPLFISGGGANLPYVREYFSVPWWPNIRNNYPIGRLPIPDDYDSDNGGAPFQRMAIAYGLTTPLPLLGKFVLPKDCPDQTPPPLPIKEWVEIYW